MEVAASANTNREKAVRTSAKMAFSGVICALCLLIMFISSLFAGLFTFLAPGIAGVIILLLYFEFDTETALTAYVATGLLSIIISPAKEPTLMFIAFFGYYPVLHMVLKKKFKSQIIRVALGLLVFNISIGLVYFFMFEVFGWATFTDVFGNIFWIFMIMGNFTYIMYGICLDNFDILYPKFFHGKIAHLFKFYA